MRLVAVDDDPPILRLFEEIGRDCGYEVETTTDGAATVDLVAQQKTDILVIDIVMPKFDGIEVLRRLSELPVAPRIILISGFDPILLKRANSLANAWGLDVIEAMTKPLDVSALRDTLSAAAGAA